MTLFEAVRALRRRLDDFAGDTNSKTLWVTDDRGCLWSNDELIEYLQEAEIEHTRRVPFIDSTTPAVCEITLAEGVSTYSLHRSILTVERVIYATEPVAKHYHEELDGLDLTGRDPIIYYQEDIDQRKIRFYNPPLADDDGEVVTLTVHRTPFRAFDWNCRDAVPYEIHERHHFNLLDYAQALAYQKAETQTEDLDRSAFFEAKFTDKVGPRRGAALEHVHKQFANRRLRTTAQFR